MPDRDPITPALALAALIGGDEPAGRAWAAAGRWGELAALAARHRLAPLLYRRLACASPGGAPDADALAGLRRAYLHALAANERARHQLIELVAGMATHGVAPVLLKGAHLAFGVYADPATRPMSDLDLLVHPDQVPAAAAAITGLGYVPMTAYSLEAERAYMAHLPAFVAPGRLPVELHWRLLRPASGYRVDIDSLRARARPFAAIGNGARVLDPADAFLHLALHGVAMDGLDGGLRALVDLALLLERAPEDPSWATAADRARHAGAERVYDLALALLERILPRRLPCPLPLPRAGGAPEQWVVELARDLALEAPADAAGVTPNVAAVFGSGPRAAIRTIVARALPPRSEMPVLDPAATGPLATLVRYPRRWVTLTTRHGSAFWNLLRGEPAARNRAHRLARSRALTRWCAADRS